MCALAALAHRDRLGAAREKVRVAHALAALPLVSATMERGAISYAKVRALTRIATPENEAALLDFAQAGTAAHVERLAGAWRRVDRVAAARRPSRGICTGTSRPGSTTTGWSSSAAVSRRRWAPSSSARSRPRPTACSARRREVPKAESLAEEVTPAQRRADALGLLAEAALTADLDRGSAGDRYQVVLHVESRPVWRQGKVCRGRVEVDHGAVDVSAETSRRLSCDASVVPMRHGADGAVLDVGRKTRTVPPSIRRALQARDQSCRFPGCTARRCDAHHVEHWIDGGATSLDNLVLLCRRHHRAVHEGGFDLIRHDDGAVTFLRPNGTVLEAAPTLPAVQRLDASRPVTTFRSGTARRSTSRMPSTCSTRLEARVPRRDPDPNRIERPG